MSSSESVFHISTVIAKVVRMYRNESNEDYTLQECVLFMVDPTVKVQHTPTLPLLVDKKSEASIVVTIRWVDSMTCSRLTSLRAFSFFFFFFFFSDETGEKRVWIRVGGENMTPQTLQEIPSQ